MGLSCKTMMSFTFQPCMYMQVAADSLAVQVGQKVYELAGGIGELPTVLWKLIKYMTIVYKRYWNYHAVHTKINCIYTEERLVWMFLWPLIWMITRWRGWNLPSGMTLCFVRVLFPVLPWGWNGTCSFLSSWTYRSRSRSGGATPSRTRSRSVWVLFSLSPRFVVLWWGCSWSVRLRLVVSLLPLCFPWALLWWRSCSCSSPSVRWTFRSGPWARSVTWFPVLSPSTLGRFRRQGPTAVWVVARGGSRGLIWWIMSVLLPRLPSLFPLLFLGCLLSVYGENKALGNEVTQ